MTNYGAIPTSSSPSANLEYISRAKDRLKAGLGTRRPWKLMYDVRSLGLPGGLRDAIARVRTNAAYFRTNYAIVVLAILFLSLLWHPISLIVFVVMMAVWLFLYFLRDEPLVLLGRPIDDRIVLAALAVLTVVFLLLTRATTNILVALLIGAVVVVLHAAFRKTDDLFLDEENAGLLTSAGAAGSSSS
ncbi:Prenylated rab acceptor [Trema orientale]|uniref:PRA1 family protein n=1 Tax=Trema orientale TaxID=63057 RepID=A0A2P5FED9_TREOI|nr:Prenylated rab acceptor [Trema orientale]